MEGTQETDQLKNAIQRLKELNRGATEDRDANLEEEYARMRDELKETKNARDEAIRSPAPSDTAAGGSHRKTVKMPDPPTLIDGKNVRFKAWKTEIRKKLRLNYDYYPTEDHKMAYLKSRCEGKAPMHIDPRMQKNPP
ncbi:hypothetical protein NUU61_005244 [Penicillium alfredii]|uniref:Uncharacterized protein n=1 Tax=Penicillium alfredii TaxID=1506179 RepID=A0A9W9F970_9EURO|nr:uncharacterized protein NUU61_005244 [Penicillium alfredii]KAJ5095888.1 hypothetical protein NUU61_005244 [Penicillium alfredii]